MTRLRNTILLGLIILGLIILGCIITDGLAEEVVLGKDVTRGTEAAIFENEQAEPLTAVERASKVLGLLKYADGREIDESVLKQTLDDFALLKQLPAKASEEAKAANFVRQLQIFLYQNSKQVALARAEASYNAESTWTKEVTAK